MVLFRTIATLFQQFASRTGDKTNTRPQLTLRILLPVLILIPAFQTRTRPPHDMGLDDYLDRNFLLRSLCALRASRLRPRRTTTKPDGLRHLYDPLWAGVLLPRLLS